MRILRITSLGYNNGGVEDGIKLNKPILERMGHTVKVLTSNARPDLEHFSDFEFDAMENKPILLRFFYRCFYPESYLSLKKILKEYKPDIIHMHTVSGLSPSVFFLLKDYPTVVTVHQSEDFTRNLIIWGFPKEFFKNHVYAIKNLTFRGWFHYLYHRYINSLVYRLGFRNVDVFIALSKYMQSELKKDGIDSTYFANSTKLFKNTPINLASKTIVYVGRLEKIKGVDYLIEALSKIKESYSDIKLLLAGMGRDKEELEKLVNNLGLRENVSFIGQQNREQLQDLYDRSAVVVIPSVWDEPFGKVGIEAMSVGRPVVGCRVGGIPEWLNDGETGYLVPPADSNAIAEKVIKLLSDKTLLEKMSIASRKRSIDFDIELYAVKIVKLYENLIGQYSKNKQL